MKLTTPTKAELQQEIARLKRFMALLEKDRMQARSLLLPNQVAVHKAAMWWYRMPEAIGRDVRLYDACERAAKEKRKAK